MTSMVYHGPSREKVSARQLAKYDIVITTYGTVQTEISKVIPEPEGKKSNRLDDLKPINLDDVDTKKAALLNIVWERIILDEAHQIRNPLGKWNYRYLCELPENSPKTLALTLLTLSGIGIIKQEKYSTLELPKGNFIW